MTKGQSTSRAIWSLMSTPDQMAIATQHDDGYAAQAASTPRVDMLINGSVT
ncbi:hypothetical protein ACNKHP_01875 [Shigella boydii]